MSSPDGPSRLLAVQACADADGVVIGSALMRMLVDGAPDAEVVDEIAAFRRALSLRALSSGRRLSDGSVHR